MSEFPYDCVMCKSLAEEKERRCANCLPYVDGWKCRPCGNWPCTCTEYLLEDR